MIALELKQETPTNKTTSPTTSKEEGGEKTSSFASLLKDMKDGPIVFALDEKNIQKQEPVQVKDSQTKGLLQALQTESTSEEMDFLKIDPQISETLSPEDLKTLVSDAKTYLKNQITQTDAFMRQETKQLPKTLKGLTELAQKLDIDISKITLQEVQVESQPVSLSTVNKLQQQDTKEPTLYVQSETDKEVKKKSNTIAKKDVTLFSLQNKTEISTEQIVSAKALQPNQNTATTPKKRSDETLQLLLQGENSMKKESSNLTNDFSAIATKTVTDKTVPSDGSTQKYQSLESLLNPTKSDEKEKNTKTEAFLSVKTDSFEVKLNEAKQMMKYLSQDVKQAIDEYKAPFTRVKVQLNPQNLGDIELTVVQRGKNLHVNLSSNNTAINTLAMNANDLKVQLQNSGINNASLNFSNNGQGAAFTDGGQAQQQQQRQNARNEYNYFDDEETNEEILSSLEIVVPNYA